MSDAIALGPLLLPTGLVVVVAASAAALFVGTRLARRAGLPEVGGTAGTGAATSGDAAGADAPADAENALWLTLLIALVAARLGFVYEFRSAYLASPLAIVDIRDGGWNPTIGLVVAWLYAIVRQRRQPVLKRPLNGALLTGSVLFLAGTIGLAVLGGAKQPLPALKLAALDGRAVNLADFAGRPTVVNLWATWCPPCVREMPVLQQAQAARPDVHFVFVNQGESADTVRNWLAGRRLELRNVLVDPRGRASAAFDQAGYPTTLFFDADGRLVSTRVGELSTATLNERLARISR